MSIERIYWFAYYNLEAPSTRYRGWYALQALKQAHDIPFSFAFPGYRPRTIFNFLVVFLQACLSNPQKSVLVFQRIHTKGLYAWMLKWLLRIRPSNTIYDLDDAIYLSEPASTMTYFMTHCQTCTVGSMALMEYVRQFNSNCHLLTSPVMQQDQTKNNRNQVFTVGWIGYFDSLQEENLFSHRKNLEALFFPALRDLGFPMKLVLLGVRKESSRQLLHQQFKHLPQVALEIPRINNWQNEPAIYDQVRSLDVGISPLLNHAMNQAKSAFKLKQYLACGVPVLASPVGENSRFLAHGENGLTCASVQEFQWGLKFFHDLSKEEYQSMSERAIETANSCSFEQYGNRWLEIANDRLTNQQQEKTPQSRPID